MSRIDLGNHISTYLKLVIKMTTSKLSKIVRKINYYIKYFVVNSHILSRKAKRKLNHIPPLSKLPQTIKEELIVFFKKFTIFVKKLPKFIRNFPPLVKRKVPTYIKLIKKHKNGIAITITAIPVAVIWGLLLYKWITTPQPAIVTNSKNSDYHFQGKSKLYKFSIGDTKTNEPKVEFSLSKEGNKKIIFYPASGNTGRDKPEEKGNKITFKDVYGNTDIVYTPIKNGIKEEIIVKKPNEYHVYPFFLELEGVNINPTFNISNGVFYDSDGNYLFNFEKPFAIDAKGNRTDNVGISIKTDSNSGKLVALLTVDKNWISDPARTYPITIDPTIVHDTNAELDTGQLNRILSKTAPTSPATGGTITYKDGYTIHTFTSSGTFTPTTSMNVEILVVGGGGGGNDGSGGGGGGGGGGVVYQPLYAVTAQEYTVTVGDGGARNTSGNNSVFDTITAVGGGKGGGYAAAGSAGGSGGGSGRDTTSAAGGSGTAGQGYNGGRATAASYGSAGGGGGAGQVGYNGGTDSGTLSGTYSRGGDGIGYSISGTITYYGGGGGGSWHSGTVMSSGGLGGGGKGGGYLNSGGYNGTAGTANTGGGGGAADSRSGTAGAGGSGIIIIRYPTFPTLETYYQELSTDPYTVGLWHMNETSGTTTVSDSSGNSNTGTSVSSTNVTTGVLGNSRSFNGSSDSISTSLNGLPSSTNTVTVEFWAYMASGLTNYQAIQASADDVANRFNIHLNWGGTTYWDFGAYDGGGRLTATCDSSLLNKWVHWAFVSEGGVGQKIYINGVLVASDNTTSTFTKGAKTLYIGRDTTTNFFKGMIDEFKISNNARTPEEIKLNASRRPYSTYTSDVIDLTNVASWNSLYWNGLGFTTADGETATASATSSLVAQWNFNETSGTTAASGGTCGTSCNGTLTSFASTGSQDAAAGTGWTSNNKRWGAGALMFDGSNDYMSVSSSGIIDPTSEYTIESWIKPTSTGPYTIYGQGNTGNNTVMLVLNVYNGNLFYNIRNDAGTEISNSGSSIPIGQWSHVVLTKSGSTYSLFVNGKMTSFTSTTPSAPYTFNTSTIGLYNRLSPANYFNGTIDSTRIYNRALTTTEILSNYNSSRIELQTRVGASTDPNDGTWEAWRPTTSETVIDNMDNPLDWATPSATIWSAGALVATSSSTFPLAEGTKSMKVQTGQNTSMTSVVGMWHLDETGGTGAYLKDSTANANNGTPTGTTIVNGISNKARKFTGATNYVHIGSTALLANSSTNSIEAWVYLTTTGVNQSIYGEGNSAGAHYYFLYVTSGNVARFDMSNGTQCNAVGSTTLAANKWYHLAGVRNAGNCYVYVNGVQDGTGAGNPGAFTLNSVDIGDLSNNGSHFYFNGYIDEVRGSNIARSAEEIAESYRMGRDHRISKTVSSTDLSSSTKLPFYVASDRLGTFMQMTYGESNFANYESDAYTSGFWHMDEQSGSGAYIKDASGTGNNGTLTGTTFTQGQIGKGRYFNGTSSDYLTVPNTLDTPLKTGTFSVSGWVKASAFTNEVVLINRGIVSSGGNYYGMGLYFTSTGLTFNRYIGNTTTTAVTYSFTPTVGTWYFAAVTYDVSTGATNLYLNGQLVASGTLSTSNVSYHASYDLGYAIGALRRNISDRYSNAIIDEVRIDNTVRTADQIRQAYEVGKRTHNITIDFKAKLDSGNLIADSSDKSFIVDETAYGSTYMASHLFLGDKIIVKENYDGTEYIAQGTVSAVNMTTGAVSVTSWDTGSTFPSGGFTVNATVFKWQREYVSLTGSLSTHRDAVTKLTYKINDGSIGANIWLDDLRSTTGYLDTPEGSTITSSIGNRYFQYRAIIDSSDPAVSASLTSVTLDYVSNSAPNTPTLDSPSDTATNQSLTPQLKTTTTDSDSDYVRYKILLCKDSDMSVSCQTFDQTSSQTGWSGQNTESNTAYTSGTQATYTIQSALDTGTTYYWKSYSIDPAGITMWSSTQSSPYSFATTRAPSAPTSPETQGQTNPTGLTTTTPYFSAIHNDLDGDSANYYQILVNTASDFSGTSMWDSGKTGMTTTTNTSRSPNLTYAGNSLSLGQTYYWKIKFWDTIGVEGEYSNTAQFSLNGVPDIPTLDLPTNGATGQIFVPVLKTTTSDDDSDYLRYKIQICSNIGMTTDCQTFDQTSSQTGWSGQNTESNTAYTSGTQATYTIQSALEVGTTYFWRSYATDPGGTNTWSSTQSSPYSFSTLTAPIAASQCRILESRDDSSLTLVWTDNATNEDYYEVQRSVDGGAFAVLETAIAANTTSNVDTSVSDGHTYQYKVAPYFSTGPAYSSWCTTSTLNLQLGTFSIKGLDLKGLILR